MTPIIGKKDLFNELLVAPSVEADTLCIITGFATPNMVRHHIKDLKDKKLKIPKIRLIVGMTPSNGISEIYHKNFVKIMNEDKQCFQCSYIAQNQTPVHSKLYTWLKNGTPIKAFSSSANYTINAFRHRQDEIATECDPTVAYSYYSSKIGDSVFCTCDEAENFVNEAPTPELHKDTTVETSDSVNLPLFSVTRNKMHEKAGLNWGQRDGREPNQAYIPVPRSIANSSFFPPAKHQFSVLTDDGFPFVCVVAQDNDKAIETPNNNSELGLYFRRKLGLKSGSFVTLDDLDRFGNRFVKFTKLNEDEYYMEYNPQS
jgi:NgoFVII restriction endonuclease.